MKFTTRIMTAILCVATVACGTDEPAVEPADDEEATTGGSGFRLMPGRGEPQPRPLEGYWMSRFGPPHD